MIVPRHKTGSSISLRGQGIGMNQDVLPEGHVRIQGVGNLRSVSYPEMTWASLQQSASPSQIDSIKIKQKNSTNPKEFRNGAELDSFKEHVDEASMIDKIDVMLKQEPARATFRQYNAALAVCQAAYERDKNNKSAVEQNMAKVGIDKLRKGKQDNYSTEFVIAECHEHNEVYVGYRGTTNISEWLNNSKAFVSQEMILGGVHTGFYEHMQVLDVNFLFNLVDSGKNVILCGHSLGGAAAAVRLITMLPRLHRTNKLLNGSVRVIAFGAPLFSTKLCAEYVVDDLNCRNLFDFIVSRGDPVPGLLSDLSQLVKQATDPNGKSANLDLALEIARNVSPIAMGVFGRWLDSNKAKLQKVLDGVESMYHPVGRFLFFGAGTVSEVLLDPCAIIKRLKEYHLDSSTVFRHQISNYEATVSPAIEFWLGRHGRGEIASYKEQSIGTCDVELGADALWIKIEDCPLHLQSVVLSAPNKNDVIFAIKDENRNEVEYSNGSIGDKIVAYGKSISSDRMTTPKKMSKITLKLQVPRQCERDGVREILKEQNAQALFITTIGNNPDPVPVGNPNNQDVTLESLAVEEITSVYNGILLSALMELVHSQSVAARRELLRQKPFVELKKVSELVMQIRGDQYAVNMSTLKFVHKLLSSSGIPAEDVKKTLDEAESVANQETQALRDVITNEDSIKMHPTAGDIAKGVCVGIVVCFVVTGIVVVGAMTGGIGVAVVPVVNSAGALASATVLTEGAAAAAAAAGLASGAASCVAMINKGAYESLYTEKLKMILKAYGADLPTQLTISAFETTLLRDADASTLILKEPKYDGRKLKPESEKLFKNMAKAFSNLIHIRRFAEQRTLVALVGVKNAGKSTAGRVLFNLSTDAGVSLATEYPKPYGWASGEYQATIVDFPGATEAKDETMQLADRYLRIGGASAWCLVHVNPFSMGTPDCKLVKDVTDRFPTDKIRIICTHGDVRDSRGRFKVDNFEGGIVGVKKYVVDMLDPDIDIDANKILVCTFANKLDELPVGVLDREELRSTILGHIWPI